MQNKSLILFAIFSSSILCNCTTVAVKSSSSLPFNSAIIPEAIASRNNENSNEVSVQMLQKLNENAGKPTFGLIMGFYQLPSTKPAGAVEITESSVFGQPYRSFWFQETASRPYAVLPVSPYQLEILSSVMKKMLDAGIYFKEVPMADALMVMRAEEKALVSGNQWMMSRLLPSGVDLLISVQKGFSETEGRIYSGRVVSTKNGRLLALATWPDTGVYSLKPLIDSLVTDTLRRLAN
ncbi:MAG: hypothetical protein O2897_05205 [bacterium]|nr:hypothetical protein [bacterium]